MSVTTELESLGCAKPLDPSQISKNVANLKGNLVHIGLALIKGNFERLDAELSCYRLSENVICLRSKGRIWQTVYRVAYTLLASMAQRVVQRDSVTPMKKQIT